MATRRWKEPDREEPVDIGVRRWHRRKLAGVGGSVRVTLPRHLLKWDRKQQSFGTRKWEAGDDVEIALCSNGVLMVRYVETPSADAEQVLDEVVESVSRYAPAKRKGKKRKMKLVTKDTKYDGRKKVYVYDDGDGD